MHLWVHFYNSLSLKYTRVCRLRIIRSLGHCYKWNPMQRDKMRREGARNIEQTVARSRKMVCEINRAGTREQRQIKSSCGVRCGATRHFLVAVAATIFPLWSHVPPHIVPRLPGVLLLSSLPASPRPWTSHLATRSLFGLQWTVSIYILRALKCPHVHGEPVHFPYECMCAARHTLTRKKEREREIETYMRSYILPSVSRRFN